MVPGSAGKRDGRMGRQEPADWTLDSAAYAASTRRRSDVDGGRMAHPRRYARSCQPRLAAAWLPLALEFARGTSRLVPTRRFQEGPFNAVPGATISKASSPPL